MFSFSIIKDFDIVEDSTVSGLLVVEDLSSHKLLLKGREETFSHRIVPGLGNRQSPSRCPAHIWLTQPFNGPFHAAVLFGENGDVKRFARVDAGRACPRAAPIGNP